MCPGTQPPILKFQAHLTSSLINKYSLAILRILIDPKKEFYKCLAIAIIYKFLSTFFSSGIENVLSILVQAAVAKGDVESVSDSIVVVV